MMAQTVTQVGKRRAARLDLESNQEKSTRTELLLEDISVEALNKKQIHYETSTSYPDRVVIPRYVPRYELEMLRRQTKRLRENRMRFPAGSFDASELQGDFFSDLSGTEGDLEEAEVQKKRLIASDFPQKSQETVGRLAAIGQRLTKSQDRPKIRKATLFDQMQRKHANITNNELADIEKLDGPPSTHIGSSGNLKRRWLKRNLAQVFNIDYSWGKERTSLHGNIEKLTSIQSTKPIPSASVASNPIPFHEKQAQGLSRNQRSRSPSNETTHRSLYQPPQSAWRAYTTKIPSDEGRGLSRSPIHGTQGRKEPKPNIPQHSTSPQSPLAAQRRPSTLSNADDKAVVLFNTSQVSSSGRHLLQESSSVSPPQQTESKTTPTLPPLEKPSQRSNTRTQKTHLHNLPPQSVTDPGSSYAEAGHLPTAKAASHNIPGSDVNHESGSGRQSSVVGQQNADNNEGSLIQRLPALKEGWGSSSSANINREGTRIPSNLASKKVLIDLGHPFQMRSV